MPGESKLNAMAVSRKGTEMKYVLMFSTLLIEPQHLLKMTLTNISLTRLQNQISSAH